MNDALMYSLIMYSLMANIFLSVCCIGLWLINRTWKCMYFKQSSSLNESGKLCQKLTDALRDSKEQIDKLNDALRVE